MTDGTWWALGAAAALAAASAARRGSGARWVAELQTRPIARARAQVDAQSQDQARGAARDAEVGFNDWDLDFPLEGHDVMSVEPWERGSPAISAGAWVKQEARKLRGSGLREHDLLEHLEAMIEDDYQEALLYHQPTRVFEARLNAAYKAFAQASGI